MEVLRGRCDNPPCINPEHLKLGADQDNANDKIARGRQSHYNSNKGLKIPQEKITRGARIGTAKLNDDKVKEIRLLYLLGYSFEDLAIEFAIQDLDIGLVIRKKTWKHVK
jgi:hypothetical protein